jgi:coproporphyrinogen III oxidase
VSRGCGSTCSACRQRICAAIADIDGTAFLDDGWHKAPGEPLQGDGLTRILERGKVFERAGCGFSHVRGQALPPSATQDRPELAGAPFEALGVSLVFHPRNPLCAHGAHECAHAGGVPGHGAGRSAGSAAAWT